MFFASKYVLQANEEAAQESVAEDELNVGLFTSLQSTNQNMFSSKRVEKIKSATNGSRVYHAEPLAFHAPQSSVAMMSAPAFASFGAAAPQAPADRGMFANAGMFGSSNQPASVNQPAAGALFGGGFPVSDGSFGPAAGGFGSAGGNQPAAGGFGFASGNQPDAGALSGGGFPVSGGGFVSGFEPAVGGLFGSNQPIFGGFGSNNQPAEDGSPMFRLPPAEPSAPKKQYRRAANVNVAALKFGLLAQNTDSIHAGDPQHCRNCSAVLNCHSVLLSVADAPQVEKAEWADMADVADDTLIWDCEFCRARNHVQMAREEQPSAPGVDYIIEPAPHVEQNVADQSVLVFCLDISGSMCVTKEVAGQFALKSKKKDFDFAALGDQDFYRPPQRNHTTWVSRLQAVQAAVDKQLETLQAQYPQRRVCLVTFSREVTIVGDGVSDPVVIAGDRLENEAQIKAVASAFPIGTGIGDARAGLSDKLWSLEEEGPTALGPALVASVSLAKQRPGSSVIICTDGLANVGVGKLDGNDDNQLVAADWYGTVGADARDAGVTVSVISLRGDECRLEHLGRVVDATGGTIDRVDPLNLGSQFANMLANAVVATQVRATMLVGRALRFRRPADQEEVNDGKSAAPSSDEVDSVLERDIGIVNEDTEFSFEYEVRSNEAMTTYARNGRVPFQVQIRFTKLDGMKCMRVLSHLQEVTDKREVAETDVDISILSANAARQSATLAKSGRTKEARVSALAHGKMMQRCAAAPSAMSVNFAGISAPQNKERVSHFFQYVQNMEAMDSTMQAQEAREEAGALSFGFGSAMQPMRPAPGAEHQPQFQALSMPAPPPRSAATKAALSDDTYVQYSNVSSFSSAKMKRQAEQDDDDEY